jgi:large subunit ribosomal protein L20
MARIKRGVTAKARHKEVLAQAKGYRGRSKNCYRIALRRVEKGLQYAYRDRRNRKRDFRALWIQRINAAARLEGLTYGRMIHGARPGGLYQPGEAGPGRAPGLTYRVPEQARGRTAPFCLAVRRDHRGATGGGHRG